MTETYEYVGPTEKTPEECRQLERRAMIRLRAAYRAMGSDATDEEIWAHLRIIHGQSGHEDRF